MRVLLHRTSSTTAYLIRVYDDDEPRDETVAAITHIRALIPDAFLVSRRVPDAE